MPRSVFWILIYCIKHQVLKFCTKKGNIFSTILSYFQVVHRQKINLKELITAAWMPISLQADIFWKSFEVGPQSPQHNHHCSTIQSCKTWFNFYAITSYFLSHHSMSSWFLSLSCSVSIPLVREHYFPPQFISFFFLRSHIFRNNPNNPQLSFYIKWWRNSFNNNCVNAQMSRKMLWWLQHILGHLFKILELHLFGHCDS